MISVEINCDSISPYSGVRLTSLVATYPRFIHSETLTHRMHSRNSASSRAIPIDKMLKSITENPALPVRWGTTQKGMQSGPPLEGDKAEFAELLWRDAMICAVGHARQMAALGVHKSLANRVVEPWAHMTAIITATEWENFFNLRCHPDAQPEFQVLAEMIRDRMAASEPVVRNTHIPFVTAEELAEWPEPYAAKVATGRIARVSYLTHYGTRDPDADVELYERIRTDQHNSPFEPCAKAIPDDEAALTFCGNFRGWCQIRHKVDPQMRHTRMLDVPSLWSGDFS